MNARGRLIVSVTDGGVGGLTVGTALGDAEDRVHTHTYAGNLSLPSKNLAADPCCDEQGAAAGNDAYSGETADGTSGLPFTQLWFCVLGANDTSVLPYGGVGYFDPALAACPRAWTPYTAANGRFIVPGYIESGGEPVVSLDPPLASQEDRGHVHTYTAAVPLDAVSYEGVDGCCNDSPAAAGTLTLAGATAAGSTNVPYIQLLTCISTTPTFNTTMPTGAVVLSPDVGCQAGWELATPLSGRFLVALPEGGMPGASFGGASLSAAAARVAQTNHTFAGSVSLPPASVGLAAGCCADGYAAAGTVDYASTTNSASSALPFLMVAVCVASPAAGH